MDHGSGAAFDATCDIAHFREEHESQVVDLLKPLWRHDRGTRARLFQWKYLENPSCNAPLGIVALHKDRVVGFRGYFANRFVLDGSDSDIVILHPGDTCVDPEYRMLGLSVAMGKRAMEYDPSRYRLLMNMTCSPNALPGYLKLGFQPLAAKGRLKRYRLGALSWGRNLWSHSLGTKKVSRIRYGKFGRILVSDAPRPAEMALVIANQQRTARALRLREDEAFFAWRYANPAHKYAFYFLMDGRTASGYVAIDVATDGINGEIVDYGARDARGLRELMAWITRSRHFEVLSIFSYGVDETLRPVLAELGFSAGRPLQWLRHPVLPILIRPTGDSPGGEDFMIEGVDMRRFDNWRLKPICSDAA